jgi:hypothetical protein
VDAWQRVQLNPRVYQKRYLYLYIRNYKLLPRCNVGEKYQKGNEKKRKKKLEKKK